VRSMSARHPNVVNAAEVDAVDGPTYGSKFGSRMRRLGSAAGGKRLGCTLYEVESGKRAFPFHAHLSNEEAIFVLEGEATLRIGDREVPLRAGDYVALPVGPGGAHQLVNTSGAVVRYLCMSTVTYPEVAIYPDSNKMGVIALEPEAMRVIFKQSGGTTLASYFEGEQAD